MKKVYTLIITLFFLLVSGTVLSQNDYSGTVRYNDDAATPVKSVTVKLFDSFGNLFDTQTSNGSGKYKFKNVPSGSYTLTYSGNLSGAKVDLRDSYLLLMRLFGFVKFSTLQELAADINEDGKVNWRDLEAMVTDYFVYGQKHAIGKVVAIPQNIYIGANSLKDGEVGVIGTGGDLEGAFEPGTKTNPKNFEVQYVNEVKLMPNQYIEIPVYLKNQAVIGGFSLSLEYSAQALSLEGLTSQIENINYNQVNGNAKIVWQNNSMGGKNIDLSQPLFTLKFRSMSEDTFTGIENITFGSESQMVDANGYNLKDAIVSLPSFSGFGTDQLNDIYPNPVYNTATIHYSLSSSYKVNLSVYNTVGQLVSKLVDEEQNAGSYEISFNRTNLHLSAGSYIYRLECKGEQPFVQSKIMIIR